MSDQERTSDLQDTANGAGVHAQEDVSTVESVNRPSSDEPFMYVPAHGRGKLLSRPPDNVVRTGPGPSPTARIRDMMREGLIDLIPQLFEDVQNGKTNKLQFADFLAKYGIGTTGTVTIVSPDVVSRLERQATLIASRASWDSAELLLAMRDVWT